MKRGRKWLRWVMPLMAVTFLSIAHTSFAQDDNYQSNDNSGNYDNNDEQLIQPENDVNYNTFHDELSPYGTWQNYPGYGNVWVCNVAGFSPYNTGGHWAYTRFGWTWVSDYNWGWAPFHYGRWGYDNAFGYFWVPGYTWGPAWVSWRNGGDYYGWAPLSPGLNVSINVGVGIGAASWIFLPHRYMGYQNSYNYYVPRQQNVTIIRNTTIINNTHVYNNNRYATGPDRRQVERYSGQQVQQQNIYVTNNRNDNRQINNGIRMYHPVVNRGVEHDRSNFQNTQPANRAAQDNVRQQPVNGHPVQSANQQPSTSTNGSGDKRPFDRFQQRRNERLEQQNNGNNNVNGTSNDAQRREEFRNRMQQSNDQRQQQNMQRQQQNQQTQQQMNDRRQQMQQQIDQQRQQQMQQRQQQIQQIREQRQPQFQQRNENPNRPSFQGNGGRKGRNS